VDPDPDVALLRDIADRLEQTVADRDAERARADAAGRKLYAEEERAEAINRALGESEGRERALREALEFCEGKTALAEEMLRGQADNAVAHGKIEAARDEARRALAVEPDGVKFAAFTNYGDLFTVEEWVAHVRNGDMNADDGSGYWAMGKKFSRDHNAFGPQPPWATHVAWFNK
jgi:hypothetical protein